MVGVANIARSKPLCSLAGTLCAVLCSYYIILTRVTGGFAKSRQSNAKSK